MRTLLHWQIYQTGKPEGWAATLGERPIVPMRPKTVLKSGLHRSNPRVQTGSNRVSLQRQVPEWLPIGGR